MKKKRMIIASLILVLVGSAGYWVYRSKQNNYSTKKDPYYSSEATSSGQTPETLQKANDNAKNLRKTQPGGLCEKLQAQYEMVDDKGNVVGCSPAGLE